jgi:hypothetical protein
MKEVLERLVGLFPAYFEALLSLLSGPKRFVAGRLKDDGSAALKNALLFLGITYLLQWALKIPLEPGDPFLALSTDTVFVLMLILSYGAALLVSWRLVGAKIELRSFFTVHFYFSAIFLVLMAILFLGMTGTIRMFDPALYGQMFDAARNGSSLKFMTQNRTELFANPAYRASMVMQLVGMTAILIWMFVGWGAYRLLSGVSRLRSFFAAVVFAVLCLPVLAITDVIANALVK